MTTKKTDLNKLSLTALLNFDVDTSVELANKATPINDTILAVAQAIEPTKEAVQKYVDEWASMCKAKGMSPASIKGLKSNRKCVLDFACSLRAGQENKEKWSYDNCQKMVKALREESEDIAAYAKKCREAIKDEEDEKEDDFDFKAKFEKLANKALENGYSVEELEFAIKLVLHPESAMDAAA